MLDRNDPDVAKIFERWEKEEIAEKAIRKIRDILSDTGRPGCFGGLGHPGMDYSHALQRISEIIDKYQKDNV